MNIIVIVYLIANKSCEHCNLDILIADRHSQNTIRGQNRKKMYTKSYTLKICYLVPEPKGKICNQMVNISAE